MNFNSNPLYYLEKFIVEKRLKYIRNPPKITITLQFWKKRLITAFSYGLIQSQIFMHHSRTLSFSFPRLEGKPTMQRTSYVIRVVILKNSKVSDMHVHHITWIKNWIYIVTARSSTVCQIEMLKVLFSFY